MESLLNNEELSALLGGIASFKDWLLEKNPEPEPIYGAFQENVPHLKFFNDPEAEKTLAAIHNKNEEEHLGNVIIPYINIELVNYSYCPQCHRIFSFKDLVNYFSNPIQESQIERQQQFRQDTRMHCRECEIFFFPSLVIIDNTPKKEFQLLCYMLIIEEIERFYQERDQQVLTKRPENVIEKDGHTGVLNDVRISDLQSKPTLIANLIYYTPTPLIIPLAEEENIKNQDFLYGLTVPSELWRREQIL